MKELLRKLARGIRWDEISRADRDLVGALQKQGIVEGHKQLRMGDDYRAGTLDIARNGYGFFEELPARRVVGNAKKGRDLRLSPHALGGADKGDLVIIRLSGPKSRSRQEREGTKARVVFIVQKGLAYTVAYLDRVRGQIAALSVKNESPVYVDAKEKALAQLPRHAVLKVDTMTGRITEVLGVLENPDVDERISLALYDKHEDFSKKAFLEAESFGRSVDKSLYPGRTDLTHLPFCTIDPVTAKDFDDAVYFDLDNLTLYVAIADVSEYVYPYSAIDDEAVERGFSIYFPHKSIPMLPRNLSENICSLKPDEDRLAFSFRITLDKETLAVVDEELIEAVIRSKKRYNYDQIDRFLSGDTHDADDLDRAMIAMLSPLYDLTAILRERRMEKGYEFHSSEVSLTLSDTGAIEKTFIEEQTASHALIEECMLLANKAAAKFFDFGIFRVHPEPKYEKIRDLISDLAAIGIDTPATRDIHTLIRTVQERVKGEDIAKYVDRLIIRSQQQATYDAYNIGHFGLGFDRYTHFTSPIRRYSDLILHRLLKAIIRKDEKSRRYILENIEDVAEKVSDLEREAAKVAWDFDDRKFARWAAENVGKTFNAVITDIDRFGEKDTIAVIDDLIYGARIFITPGNENLFETIRVTIAGANIATTKIAGIRADVQKRV